MLSTSVSSHAVLAALINLDHPGHFVHWGFIQISVANIIVIGLMVLVFAAAILVPFSHRDRGER